MLGASHFAEGKVDAARTCFERARALAPADVELAVNAGVVLHEAGELERALDAFDGALALAPAEAVAARQAREARYGEDDDEEAEEAEGEGEYVVERLLDERRSAAVHGGKCEFLVKWKSYGDETWEPEEHVDDCGPYDDWVKERKEAADALAERAEALLAGLA